MQKHSHPSLILKPIAKLWKWLRLVLEAWPAFLCLLDTHDGYHVLRIESLISASSTWPCEKYICVYCIQPMYIQTILQRKERSPCPLSLQCLSNSNKIGLSNTKQALKLGQRYAFVLIVQAPRSQIVCVFRHSVALLPSFFIYFVLVSFSSIRYNNNRHSSVPYQILCITPHNPMG